MYKMFFPSGNAVEFCDHVFRTFDMDRNGYIDFKVSVQYRNAINPYEAIHYTAMFTFIIEMNLISLTLMSKQAELKY